MVVCIVAGVTSVAKQTVFAYHSLRALKRSVLSRGVAASTYSIRACATSQCKQTSTRGQMLCNTLAQPFMCFGAVLSQYAPNLLSVGHSNLIIWEDAVVTWTCLCQHAVTVHCAHAEGPGTANRRPVYCYVSKRCAHYGANAQVDTGPSTKPLACNGPYLNLPQCATCIEQVHYCLLRGHVRPEEPTCKIL